MSRGAGGREVEGADACVDTHRPATPAVPLVRAVPSGMDDGAQWTGPAATLTHVVAGRKTVGEGHVGALRAPLSRARPAPENVSDFKINEQTLMDVLKKNRYFL